MRFVKQLQLNRKLIEDRSVFVDVSGAVSFEGGTGGLVIGGGETDERGSTPANGQIRYNTTTGNMEAYVNNAWETIQTDRANLISIQNLGTGDASETSFGPLSPTPKRAESILVLVENVVQIAGVNYTLTTNGDGTKQVKFDSAVPLGKDVTVIHGFDGSQVDNT